MTIAPFILPSIPNLKPATITRHHELGTHFTLVRRLGLNELHITLQQLPGEALAITLLRLEELLREHDAVITRMEVFGSCKAYGPFLTAMRRILGEPCWPVMWLEGGSLNGEPLAGLHVMAVSGSDVETLRLHGRVVGTIFSDAHARHCLLGDVMPSRRSAVRRQQAREVFENMALALQAADMEPRHIARTWLYLDDLLSWYGDLNKARTEIFGEWELFKTGVPASTGIGAKNPHGAAMVAGAWASVAFSRNHKVHEVVSPLQCPAGSYGSSFARAMEWSTPGHRRLTVSGTASIEPGGASVHQGDIRAQVDLTMDVVEAILDSRGASFRDVTRATAYIKHPKDHLCLEQWFERSGKPWFSAIGTHTQVCRDELLFEIELDTIVENQELRA